MQLLEKTEENTVIFDELMTQTIYINSSFLFGKLTNIEVAMKYINKILLLCAFISSGIHLHGEETQSIHIEQHTNNSKAKNLEPVFPIEDIIEKPSKQTDRFLTEFLNMLASLGLIIGLILIAVWFLKRLATTRLQQVNQTSVIKVLDKRMLSPKTMIYLLEIEGTGYVVSESVNGVTRISEFPILKEIENPPSPPSKVFENLLNKPG